MGWIQPHLNSPPSSCQKSIRRHSHTHRPVKCYHGCNADDPLPPLTREHCQRWRRATHKSFLSQTSLLLPPPEALLTRLHVSSRPAEGPASALTDGTSTTHPAPAEVFTALHLTIFSPEFLIKEHSSPYSPGLSLFSQSGVLVWFEIISDAELKCSAGRRLLSF